VNEVSKRMPKNKTPLEKFEPAIFISTHPPKLAELKAEKFEHFRDGSEYCNISLNSIRLIFQSPCSVKFKGPKNSFQLIDFREYKKAQ
jgi:hypothetical protein